MKTLKLFVTFQPTSITPDYYGKIIEMIACRKTEAELRASQYI